MSVRPVPEERVNGGGFAARGLTIGALVAAALMALAALAFVALGLPRGGAVTRPVMVAVGQALDKMRSQLAAQRGAKVDQQAAAARASAATVSAAGARYASSVRTLDGAWNALAPSTSRALTEGQRAWIAHKHEVCRLAAARASADAALREAERLKCETGANLARARWVEAAARAGAMRAPVAVVSVSEACQVLRRRGWRLGETLTFTGEYSVERPGGMALLRPLGCEQETGIAGVAVAARRQLDAVAPPWATPQRRVVGRFTARLVLAPRDGARFFDDDGVRLQVTGVSGLHALVPIGAHAHAPAHRRSAHRR